MRAAGRHTVPPLILKRVRRPPPDPDSPLQPRQSPPVMRPAHLADPATAVRHATSLTLQTRQPPSAMRPAHLADPATAARHATSLTLQPRQSPPAMRTSPPCRPGNRRPPVMPPFSIQVQPLPHGAGGPHAKQTVVSRPRRPSTAKRGRGDSRKGPQLAGGGLRREGVAEGRGSRGKGSRREGTTEGRGAIGRPAAVSGRDPQGVRQSFSQALYHLQA